MIENEDKMPRDLYFGVRAFDPWIAERWITEPLSEPRPADEVCECHGKTEAEIALPYALFAFSLPVLAIVGALIGWALR